MDNCNLLGSCELMIFEFLSIPYGAFIFKDSLALLSFCFCALVFNVSVELLCDFLLVGFILKWGVHHLLLKFQYSLQQSLSNKASFDAIFLHFLLREILLLELSGVNIMILHFWAKQEGPLALLRINITLRFMFECVLCQLGREDLIAGIIPIGN